jgi:hypothetical protein
VFLLFTAMRSHSGEAERIDATLRRFASAPVGPWLLAVVAIELVMFGASSCAEARWRRL